MAGHSLHTPPFRIAVLAGGKSAERAVSLESGAGVSKALTEAGQIISRIDPAETNLRSVDWRGFDAAFLALHGQFGEDGHVQNLLEEFDVAYTGSDAAASRLAYSKSASKERFAQAGVPTPPYVLIHQTDDFAQIHQKAANLGYPLVVKPDTQGSSLGVTIVDTPDQLPQALSHSFHFDVFGVMERYITGEEWTLGVLDSRPLPLIQITTPRRFYDYDAKYNEETTGYHFENTLPAEVVRAIEVAGRGAAEALGTRGIARVDLRLDEKHRPWVLEINTIPGFTSHSLIPKSAAKAGIDFGELCLWAIHRARAEAAARRLQPRLAKASEPAAGEGGPRFSRSSPGARVR